MSNQPIDLKVLQQQLETYIQQAEYGRNSSCQLLAHGEANVIFRINQTTLIRVAVNTPNQRFGGDFRQVTQFEQAILTYLQGTGIGHELQSSRLDISDTFPYTFLITNYLDGVALDYSRDHLQQCAQTLAKLHRLPLSTDYKVDRLHGQVPFIQQPLTLFYQEAKDYAQPYFDSPNAEPEIIEMLQLILDKAQVGLKQEALIEQHPHVCLVHGDHTYDNWVVGDRRAYLIDWEWAELGSPAGDLGHFLSPVTICRRQGYRLPAADRAFFLKHYYQTLDDPDLAQRIQQHFIAFGAYPAVRSLCWTAGYWVTANRWYAEAENDSAIERMAQLRKSREQFSELWQEVMDGFNDL